MAYIQYRQDRYGTNTATYAHQHANKLVFGVYLVLSIAYGLECVRNVLCDVSGYSLALCSAHIVEKILRAVFFGCYFCLSMLILRDTTYSLFTCFSRFFYSFHLSLRILLFFSIFFFSFRFVSSIRFFISVQ